MPITESPLVEKIKATAKKQTQDQSRGSFNRKDYIAECKDNINKFTHTYPSYWIEYIRSRKKSEHYYGMLRLKSWLRESGAIDDNGHFDLMHQLVDDKLSVYRRPRGAVVAAVVDGKLYTSYSLCNFSSGDSWNNSIALWKAMKRIVYLKLLPCPVVEIKITSEFVNSGYSLADLADWSMQFPSSTREVALGLTKRILEKYMSDNSVAIADLLPVIP